MCHLLPFNTHQENAVSKESWEVCSASSSTYETQEGAPQRLGDVPMARMCRCQLRVSMQDRPVSRRLWVPDSNELKSTENVQQSRKLAPLKSHEPQKRKRKIHGK